MPKNITHKKALAALNYDLFFESPMLTVAGSLTGNVRQDQSVGDQGKSMPLPSIEELYRHFDRYNWMYFGGKLPRVRLEYSGRMTSAGSYTPSQRLIKIGSRYHRLFPEEIEDTLKHEMIHILYLRHDAAFKREAARVGASVRAKSHPSLRRAPRYVYFCPSCGRQYPRQKRLRMASCGYCSDGGRFDSRCKLKLFKAAK